MRHLLLGFTLLTIAANAETVPSNGPVRGAVKATRVNELRVERDADHVFPYLLASSAWTTTLHITNLEDHEIKVTCEFVGTEGEEKPLAFDFDSANPTAFSESTISSLATTSFKTVSTSTTLTTAWAYCSAEPRTERFSGYAILRNTASNGAVREFATVLQPDSEPVFSIPFLPAADNTTGLILVNTDVESNSSFGVWMIDPNGKQVATGQITLKPGALRLIVLNESFKDVKEGTVRVVVTDGSKNVTGFGLRTSVAGYTALAPLAPKADPEP